MGGFYPVYLAMLQNAWGGTLFHKALPGDFQNSDSTVIFLFAVYLLLRKVEIFPRNMRPIWKLWAAIYEFLVSTFIMECLLHRFWYRIERSVGGIMRIIARYENAVLAEHGIKTRGVLSKLDSDAVVTLSSFFLSLCFLIVAAYATRALDDVDRLLYRFIVYLNNIIEELDEVFHSPNWRARLANWLWSCLTLKNLLWLSIHLIGFMLYKL